MPFNDDFPVPLAKFAKLVIGTPDEVWLQTVQIEHGSEKHTELGWSKLLASYWKKGR